VEGTGAAAFAALLAQETTEAAEVVPPEAVGGVPRRGEVVNDRTARRHGRAMLHALGALQLALLLPPTPDPEADREEDARAHLADLARRMPAAEDPVLRLILREISVRAAVELARSDS
jgi:hypothetical protein